jgi:hypothetical protein
MSYGISICGLEVLIAAALTADDLRKSGTRHRSLVMGGRRRACPSRSSVMKPPRRRIDANRLKLVKDRDFPLLARAAPPANASGKRRQNGVARGDW